MQRTTEQVEYDALIKEIKELRDDAPNHSMSDNARNLASKVSETLDKLAGIANSESDLKHDGTWEDFNDPLQDSVNDAFHAFDLISGSRKPIDPHREHRFGHFEYGLERT